MIEKIISGGQTGADRAGLDFAIDNNISHGGWCPKGRLAEDGPIDSKYHLIETKSARYPVRTEMNIKNSDGTLIFVDDLLDGGSLKTKNLCDRLKKPYLICSSITSHKISTHTLEIEAFIMDNKIHVINVAGNRESKSPGIYKHVYSVFTEISHNLFTSKQTLEDILR